MLTTCSVTKIVLIKSKYNCYVALLPTLLCGLGWLLLSLLCLWSDCAVPFVRVCSSGGHHSVLVCSVLVSADLHCHRCSRSLRIKIVKSKPCWPIAEAVVNYTHISCWYWYCNACCTIYTLYWSSLCSLTTTPWSIPRLWRQPCWGYCCCFLASVSVEAAVLVCDSWSSLLLTHGLLVLASVTVEAVVFSLSL